MNAEQQPIPVCRQAAAFSAALATAAAFGLAGCATRTVDAQWVDPQLSGRPLSGSPVYVVCEAAEAVLGQICAERLVAALRERGLTVVAAPAATQTAPGQPADDSRYLAPARAAGAGTVWAARVGQDLPDVYRGGSGITIGLGGFSFGRGGGVGVGVTAPLGGLARPGLQYAADARVTDAASGRLLWAARAGSPAAGDVPGQLGDLLQRLVSAAAETPLF